MKSLFYIVPLVFVVFGLTCCTKELMYERTGVSEGGDENFIGDHQYVLIGGVKWATMNIGATTIAGSYETCSGDYFAWGEVTPRYTSKGKTDGTGASLSYWTFDFKTQYATGYDASNYVSIGTKTLDSGHDAVTAIWGKAWRMPTRKDFLSLAAACTGKNETKQEFMTLSDRITHGGIYMIDDAQLFEPEYSGVAGILFVSQSDISKRVFFPAVGYVSKSSARLVGRTAKYCSSDANANNMCYTFNYSLNSLVQMDVVSTKSYGYPIRPVAK